MLLATALRLILLDRKSLWGDELASIAIAGGDWPAFWTMVSRFQANGGLYYLILRLWMGLGTDEWTLRALSVLPSVAAVPVVYLIGRRLADHRTGVIASLLLAVHGLHLQYAQEARPYSFLVLLGALSALLLLEGMERGGRWWVGHVAAAALSVYVHFFGWLTLAAQWTVARARVPWRTFWAVVGALFVLTAPLAVFVLTRDLGQVDWIEPPRLPRDPYKVVVGLAGNGGLLPLLGYLAAWGLALRPPRDWRHRFLVAWLFGPLVLALVLSPVKPLVVPRYFIASVPAAVILAAMGVCRTRAKALWAAALVLLSTGAIVNQYTFPDPENWRATFQHLRAAQARDGIVIAGASAEPATAYYGSRDPRISAQLTGAMVGTCPSHESLAALMKRQRVWVVQNHLRSRGLPCAGRPPIPTGFQPKGTWQFGAVRVTLYDRP